MFHTKLKIYDVNRKVIQIFKSIYKTVMKLQHILKMAMTSMSYTILMKTLCKHWLKLRENTM